jgi:hypothetical protein
VSEELQVNVKPVKKGESVRAWYHRTTSGARKFLLIFSAIAICLAVVMFIYAPQSLHVSIQQFNGAYVIPVAGGIWILGFLYIFLIPQREVGFRSQEFIESMSNSVRETIEREIVPAVAVWKRLGEKIEAELPIFMKKVDEGILQIQESAKKLTVAIEKNEGLAADIKPAVDSLKRIEAKFEGEIKNGFFEKATAALESVRSLGGIPGKDDSEENLSYALDSIKKNKALRRTS